MALAFDSARWEALAARGHAGTSGEGIASVLALLGRPDLISFAGGFPDPETFPRERVAALLAEFAAAGRVARLPVRAHARPAGRARRARRSARASAGPPPRRRRAADHERRDRGARAASASRSSIPATWSSSRRRRISGRSRRSAASRPELVPVPIDEDGLHVDELEQRLAGGARAEAALHDPGPSEPGRVSSRRRAPRAARRARALLRLPDRRGRRLPRARLRGRGGAEPVEPRRRTWSCRPGPRRRRSSPASGSAGRSGRRRSCAELVAAKQTTDQCAGALGQRLFEEYVRRGWIDEQLARSRALYRRKCERMLAALERKMPERRAWTTPQGGFFSWLTLPPGVDAIDLARRAAERGVGDRARARSSTRTAAAATPCACPSPRRRGADRRRHRVAAGSIL